MSIYVCFFFDISVHFWVLMSSCVYLCVLMDISVCFFDFSGYWWVFVYFWALMGNFVYFFFNMGSWTPNLGFYFSLCVGVSAGTGEHNSLGENAEIEGFLFCFNVFKTSNVIFFLLTKASKAFFLFFNMGAKEKVEFCCFSQTPRWSFKGLTVYEVVLGLLLGWMIFGFCVNDFLGFCLMKMKMRWGRRCWSWERIKGRRCWKI